MAATLNPIFSKSEITTTTQLVYSCPANKTHAIIDISFFKDDVSQDSLIAVALSSDSNPANLTTVDFFIDDIQLVGGTNTAELNKVIVGAGQFVYVKIIEGVNVNVRVTGVEENNSLVLQAGRLAAASISGTGQTQIYSTLLSNVAYVSSSITIYNTSTLNSATIEAWISSSATPSDAADKVLKLVVPINDTAILENLILAPNDKVFVKSSEPNAEFFINGVVLKNA